jgi:ribonucleoside-diphosphate reductase alpha chain
VPAEWSQVACDILAQKYLRKAGVPALVAAVEEEGVPPWLWRRTADEAALALLPKAERNCGETSAKQCFDRLAGTWTYWAWKGGYFDGEDDARAFFDELRLMLARQMGAPNSPQWFNTGLHWAYGIDGPAQGHYYVDYGTGTKAASWICGCARLGCSNTARAPAPISPACAATAKGCLAAGARPG